MTMLGNTSIPHRSQLRDYHHAVAGHAGTLCTEDGELFIKPCTQSEIDFYHSANRRHPDFAELMPLFMGTLSLSDPDSVHIDEAVAGVISDEGEIQATKDHISATIAAEVARKAAEEKKATADGTWVPNKSKKIDTDKAVVLDNASFGFKQPNILDAKLGVRLWADDAPLAKKQRFDKISSETTHGNLGFRIAGMRVYRGSEDPAELGEDDYRVYDKDYGRVAVNDDNVVREFRRFIFNKAAGVDEELGRAVCAAFVRELKKVEEVLMSHESRMYSASLLFVFEGDGEALSSAIEANNARADAEALEQTEKPDRTTRRVDSGIALEDSDSDSDSDDDLDLSALPRIFSLKMIDFAHAQWTPGQGPDENTLTGVRSLIRIFEEMAQ
jgi:1D-myo-inositol-tetrakisphosphate 5-kinase/inositol-polyphosphate multikinase